MRRPSLRSIEERNALVVQWRRLPGYCYGKLAPVYPRVKRLGEDESCSVGMLALIRAAELWDAAREVQFNTYAYWSISSRILTAARRSLIRTPTHEYRVQDQAACERARRIRPLIQEEGKEWLTDGGAAVREMEHAVEMRENVERVADLLTRLPLRQRFILERGFLGDCSLSKLGKQFGISTERVRQIKNRALAKLRMCLGENSGW